MTESTSDEALNLREQIVRIDRNIAEVEKLQAEARKFKVESQWEPWKVLLSALAGLGAWSAFLVFLHWWAR